ncbi:hypothetical protein VKS41_007185 [Umbelopsis sp. WA50703]
MSESDILRIQNTSVYVAPHQKTFTFDYVFGPNSAQDEIFVTLADPLIHKFIDGYNVTILAYGQTSSGKTYTMGTAQHGESYDIQEEGIIPRAMSLLFETLQRMNIPQFRDTRSKLEKKFRPLSVPAAIEDLRRNKNSIKVSFVEIYNEDLVDLLNPAPPSERPPVTIREDTKGQIYWSGVRELPVESTDDVLNFLEQGTQNRATGATDMNEKSSRSHAIFSVTLRQEKWVPTNGSSPSASSILRSPSPSVLANKSNGLRRPESSAGFRTSDMSGEEGEWVITHSKFHFVDLAGSERLKRTAAEGDRRKEGININGGLLALGNVISALGDPSKKSTHVPYRDSKLTRLLQDSLGGNATTLMIACVSPAEYNLVETVNTLMYANRARNIRNRSEKNEFEEWQTNDNAEFLRGVITKLKNELGAFKATSFAASTAGKDLTMSSPSLISDVHSSPSSSPDLEQIFLDQRNEIMNLQHLIEKLEGELAVTQERERVAEEQLQHMWNNDSGPRSQDIEKLKQEVDFEHLVEPVIEEYEKSISVLESQLAMARAALHHSDIGFEEQSARITHQEQLNENQSHIINELKSRISKITEREQSNDLYIEELERKLSKATQDSIRDQEALNDLKTKLSKLTETEDSTEKYINSLEQRLANVEKEKEALMEMLQSLEVAIAAKDSALEAMKIRTEQAEGGDDKKMLLQELDDVLQRHQDLESTHQQLRMKYEALEKRLTVNVNGDESVKEKMQTVDGEQDSVGVNGDKRLSRSFQQEMSDHQQATDVVNKTKEIEHLKTHITNLQLDLTNLKEQNEKTLEKLDASVKANENAATQIDKLEKTVQEHRARSAELVEIAPEIDSAPALDLQKEIEQELGSSKLREQSLRRELEDLHQQLQLKDTKLTMRDNDYSQLQHSLKSVQQRLEIAEQTISESQTKEQDLTNGFETERKLLQKSTGHLESEIEMLTLERNSLLTQIAEFEANSQKVEARTGNTDQSPSKIAKAADGVNEVDHVLPENGQPIAGELEAARSDVAKLSVSLDDLYAKYHQLQETLMEKETELLAAQEYSAKSKNEVELLNKEHSVLKQKLSDMQKSLPQETDSDKSQADNQHIVEELKLAQQQLESSNQTILSLQNELSDSAVSSALLAQELSEKLADQDQVKQSYDAFPEYQNLLADLNASKANHDLAKESLQILQQQLHDSMDKNSQLTEQLTQAHEAAATTVSTFNNEMEVVELRSKLQSSEHDLEIVNTRMLEIQKQYDETTANLSAAIQKVMEMLEVKEKVSATPQLQNGHSQFSKEIQEKEAELAKSVEKSNLLEIQLQSLTKSHTDATEQLSELTATLLESEANSQLLQKSLESKTNEHNDAVHRAQALQKEMEMTTASLKDDLTSKHDIVAQKLVELLAKHDALQNQYDSAVNNYRSIVEEQEQSTLSVRTSVDELTKLLESTRSEKEAIEQQLKEQIEQSDSLQNSVHELTKSLNETRIDKAAIEERMKIQMAQTSEAQTTLERQLAITSDLESKLDDMKLNLERLEAETAEASVALHSKHQMEREEEVELYQNAIMELETKLQNISQANTKELQLVSDRHAESEQQIIKIKAEIVERDMFITELEASICKMEEELKMSQSLLQESANASSKLQGTVNLQVDEIERLKLDLELTHQEVKEKNNDQLQSLDRQLKALQNETEEYNTLIEQMDTHLQNKSDEMEEIIAELASAEAEKVQQQARIGELEQQLANGKSQDMNRDQVDDKNDSLVHSQLQEAMAELYKTSKEKDDLLGEIEQLTVDKSQLQSKLSAVENQVEVQSLKLSKEVADLRNEVDSLINKNEELEKQVAQQPNKRSSRAFAATRDTPSSIISPPQTPRISSPSPDALQNKLKLHESTIAQQASLIKSLEDRVQQSINQRTSLDEPSSHLNTNTSKMRKSASSSHLPPPPSEPLPPLPKAPTITKTASILSTRSGSAPEEVANISSTSTTEQDEKTIKSLQKKLDAGESDVKAHLEVITKLEQQLFRAENALKEARKRVTLSPTRTNSINENGELDQAKQQLSAMTTQLTEQQEQSARDVKKLQEELEATRKAKEKAEKARVILENRIDQLMSKKSKFMCF